MEWRYERLGPEELEQTRDRCPVVFVPIGSLEFHGWHLPVGLDAIKVHALCGRVVTALGGGVVLPPLFCGIGGGHLLFDWTIMHDEDVIERLLVRTLERLADFGYRVAVVLTGHYPGEQVHLIERVAQIVMTARSGYVVLALPEHAARLSQPSLDHAAKWETSLMLELDPELVRLERLRIASDGSARPASVYATQDHHQVGVCMDRQDPLYGILGLDPRTHASAGAGRAAVEEMVATLVIWIRQALARVGCGQHQTQGNGSTVSSGPNST